MGDDSCVARDRGREQYLAGEPPTTGGSSTGWRGAEVEERTGNKVEVMGGTVNEDCEVP